MIDGEDLAKAFERNLWIVRRQCQGLTHADSLIRPPFNSNCLNWILGHIAESRDRALALLGEPPALGAAGARYRRESEPIAGDEEGVLRLEELLDALGRGQERLGAALRRATAEDLERQIEAFGRADSVHRWLFFLYFHDSYHTGQTDLLRQAAGKNDKII